MSVLYGEHIIHGFPLANTTQRQDRSTVAAAYLHEAQGDDASAAHADSLRLLTQPAGLATISYDRSGIPEAEQRHHQAITKIRQQLPEAHQAFVFTHPDEDPDVQQVTLPTAVVPDYLRSVTRGQNEALAIKGHTHNFAGLGFDSAYHRIPQDVTTRDIFIEDAHQQTNPPDPAHARRGGAPMPSGPHEAGEERQPIELEDGATMRDIQTARGRLVRDVRPNDPTSPIQNAQEARREAEAWSNTASGEAISGDESWKYKQLEQVRTHAADYSREKNPAIAAQIKQDWNDVAEQVEVMQKQQAAGANQDDSRRLVEIKHPDGSREQGLVRVDADGGASKEGAWVSTSAQGTITEYAQYKNGHRDGETRRYDDQGRVEAIGQYEQGKPVGQHREFEQAGGNATKVINYTQDGEVASEHHLDQQPQQNRERGPGATERKRDFSQVF